MLQADYGPDIRAGIWAHSGYQGVTPARRQEAQRGALGGPHLLQAPPLLLLLLYALLALGQQLPLVFLVLSLLLFQLLPPQGLGPLLVGQLQPQEVPPQSRLPWQVQNGAVGRRERSEFLMGQRQSLPWVLGGVDRGTTLARMWQKKSHAQEPALKSSINYTSHPPKETESR